MNVAIRLMNPYRDQPSDQFDRLSILCVKLTLRNEIDTRIYVIQIPHF